MTSDAADIAVGRAWLVELAGRQTQFVACLGTCSWAGGHGRSSRRWCFWLLGRQDRCGSGCPEPWRQDKQLEIDVAALRGQATSEVYGHGSQDLDAGSGPAPDATGRWPVFLFWQDRLSGRAGLSRRRADGAKSTPSRQEDDVLTPAGIPSRSTCAGPPASCMSPRKRWNVALTSWAASLRRKRRTRKLPCGQPLGRTNWRSSFRATGRQSWKRRQTGWRGMALHRARRKFSARIRSYPGAGHGPGRAG